MKEVEKMDREALRKIMDKVSVGTKLQLTFKQGQGEKQVLDSSERDSIAHFGLMIGAELTTATTDSSLAFVLAASSYGSWGADKNRVFVVTVCQGFKHDWFVEHLWKGLEKVEVLPAA